MFPIPFNFPFRKKDGSVTSIGAAIDAGGGSYELPTASGNTKGGVKIGSRLTMTGEVLSADLQLPAHDIEDAGKVLAINNEGALVWITGGGVTLDTTNQKAIFGVIDNYEYSVNVNKIYVGEHIDGYEIKTNPQSSSSDAQIDLYSIQYAQGEIKGSSFITTVHHTGGGYVDNNIQISYVGGNWTVVLLKTFYETDGTAWTSPVSWNYAIVKDYVFLEESPV